MILTERTYKKIHNTVKIKLVWRREEMCAASLTYTECILTVWRNSGIPSVYVTRDTTDHQASSSSPRTQVFFIKLDYQVFLRGCLPLAGLYV